MHSRSRSRKSSRSPSSFRSGSILEYGGEPPLQDTVVHGRDGIELVSRTTSSDYPRPIHAQSGSAARNVTEASPGSNTELHDFELEASTGSRVDPTTSDQRTRLPHKLFGVHNDQLRGHLPQTGLSTDYKKKYPEDPAYKETESNARVWHVYNDECQIFDNDMVIEAGDNLDILLVFAGLFASVLTTFVAQTSQSLSLDKTDISNSLLHELISLQRAAGNGTSFDSIPAADTSFSASRSDIWVNSLWFISLALSLSTALLAVIAKQWLRQYSSFISGTPRERALIRQFRYDGLEKWGVRLIIGLLPTILHVSLFLFMAGLVIFLLPLSKTLARIVAGIAGFICAAYIITNFLPVIFIQCPYRTPLSEILNSIHRAATIILATISSLVRLLLVHLKVLQANVVDQWDNVWLSESADGSKGSKSLKEVERVRANKGDEWGRPLGILDALSWLAHTTSDISADAIVAEAVGSVAHPPLDIFQQTPLRDALNRQWANISPRVYAGEIFTPEDERIVERLLRGAWLTSSLISWKLLRGVAPINCRAHRTLMLMSATSDCVSRLNDEVDLLPSLTFRFVAERTGLAMEMEAPTWMWWSLFMHAALVTDDWFKHQERISDICVSGRSAYIDANRLNWLGKVNLPLALRDLVRERIIDTFFEDTERPLSPEMLNRLSELFVARASEYIPPPLSPVSLVTFLVDNFAQFTGFWMERAEAGFSNSVVLSD